MASVLPIVDLVEAIVGNLLVFGLPGSIIEGGVDSLVKVSTDGLADALGKCQNEVGEGGGERRWERGRCT